jgi:hypothetical protein
LTKTQAKLAEEALAKEALRQEKEGLEREFAEVRGSRPGRCVCLFSPGEGRAVEGPQGLRLAARSCDSAAGHTGLAV